MVFPMTFAEKISQVPELYDRTNKSTACLLKDAGFLNSPEPLKVEEVEEALRHHPDWADRWLERGHDQLLAGGWGIECDHGRYRVQSFSSGRHLLEQKKMHACWSRKRCTRWQSLSCAMSALSGTSSTVTGDPNVR